MAEFDASDRMTRDLRGQNPLPPQGPVPSMRDTLLRNGGGGMPGVEVSERPVAAGDAKLFPKAPGIAAEAEALHGERVNPGPARSNFVSPGTGSLFGPAPAGPTNPNSVADRLRAGAQTAWDDMRGRPNVGPQQPLSGIARYKDLAGQGANLTGKVIGGVTVGDSAVQNGEAMGRLWANDKAGVLDKVVGTAEGLGNVATETALSFTKKFPIIGPMIAGAVGPSPVSRLASLTPSGSTLQRYADADPTTNAERMLRTPVSPRAVAPATSATTPALTDVQRGGGNAAPVAPNNVLRVGNSYSGPEGISGDIQVNNRPGGGTVSMMGGQPGDATPEQRLAQIHRDSAHMAEMNAMRQQLSDGANPMAGVSGLIGSGGYGGARTPEQLARDAAVSASSITNTQGISSREAARLKREDARMLLEARRNDQNNDTLRRGQDITGRGQELQHSATLRGQDITGRGQDMTYDAAMYGHNVDLQGKMAPIEMKKAQMQRARMILNHPSVAGDMGRASALAAQTGDTELANALLAQAKDAQTLGHNASTNADRASESFATATDKDGKGYIDPAKLATARTLRQNIAPGYDQMSESQRAVAKPVVDAGQNIVMGMNKVDRPTFAQMIRWDGPSPQLTTVPDLRDAKVDYVGALDHERLIPGNNIRRGDVRMRLRDGTTRYIPREHYNANEMDVVKRHSGNKN